MQTKQVIVFRKDLLKGENGIRKGKFGAQCAHASLCAFLSYFEQKTSLSIDSNKQLFQLKYEENAENAIYSNWTNGIYTEVVLGVENEDELMKVYHTFQDKKLFPNGLPLALITDIGKTEFHGNATVTCLGVGPYISEELDHVTKEIFNLKPL